MWDIRETGFLPNEGAEDEGKSRASLWRLTEVKDAGGVFFGFGHNSKPQVDGLCRAALWQRVTRSQTLLGRMGISTE